MDRASDSGSEGWGFESLPAYQKSRHPNGCLLFWYIGREDSKGRPRRSRGEKQSGGLFFRPWESPSVPGCIPEGCRRKRRTTPHKGICFFWFMPEGTRKGGLSEAKVRKCPVDTFVARGRVPPFPDASRRDVDGNGEPPLFAFFPSNFPSFLVDIATFFYFLYIILLFSCIFIK